MYRIYLALACTAHYDALRVTVQASTTGLPPLVVVTDYWGHPMRTTQAEADSEEQLSEFNGIDDLVQIRHLEELQQTLIQAQNYDPFGTYWKLLHYDTDPLKPLFCPA